MKTINCEFKPIQKPTLDRIKMAMESSDRLREETSQQVKRVRRKTLRRCQAQRKRVLAELEQVQQQQKNAWRLQIAEERQKLHADLVNHIEAKCQEIIHRTLIELIDQVPEVTLDWACKKLSQLLHQIGRSQEVTITAAAETVAYPAFTKICSREGLKAIAEKSQLPGSLLLSLPNGKILSSLEQDLEQLMQHWGNSIELVKELHAFVGQSE